jgi:cell division protein FtsI/penicillin-binding protein 2
LKERIIEQSTCEVIKKGLEKTVTDGTGTSAKSELFECCAKTATAQSGQYDENGKEILYCWFSGFFPKENPQYTICIMKENGSSGGSDCGPVFKEIAENILLNF